ncbi:hypothetical protein [uncultured Roseobacter sp.]|uniref:hypothetical protein n=1 Tax=uncultured Roseobacter sp. TaxID=114847 RepID=UPI00262182BE|nr:hypothetical protein [uncultured Roseobacter sp.]
MKRPAPSPVDHLLAQIDSTDAVHRKRQDVATHEPSEVLVDRFGFPFSIGKDCYIWHWANFAMHGH